jgi:hypothetical protein
MGIIPGLNNLKKKPTNGRFSVLSAAGATIRLESLRRK